jgi:hypothetical protein
MKSLLRDFEVLYEQHAEFKRQLDNYTRVVKTPEWKFFQDMLLTMRGTIVTEMLSKRYTILDREEKDIAQKTFYNIVQLLDFWGNPVGWIKKKQGRLRTAVQNTVRK